MAREGVKAGDTAFLKCRPLRSFGTLGARGRRPWQRFWHVTWPLLKPVTVVVVVFSVIQTFADFQLIYVLTGGGPANSTHLLATYAYQTGVASGLLGQGAAISLFMFPVLFVVVWIQLRYVRRLEGV